MEVIRADGNIQACELYDQRLQSEQRYVTYMTLWRRCILLQMQFHAERFAADLLKFYESDRRLQFYYLIS